MVSAVVDGSGTVCSAIVIYKISCAVVVDITFTVLSWSPIVVIIIAVGAEFFVVSFVVISFDIVDIKKIVLENGAVIVDDEGAGTIKSTHRTFIWYIAIMTTLLLMFMDGD